MKPHTMRTVLSALTFAAVVAISSAGIAHEDDDKATAPEAFTATQKEIVDVLDRYAAAMEAADFDAIEALALSDDSFSAFEGSHLDLGWEAYRDHVAPEMALFEDTRYQLSDVRPVVVGEGAYVTLRYEMDVVVVSDQFESGRHPIHMSGVGTVVLAKHEGTWKIRHLHMAREKGEVKEE